jgi:hypothetical protein
VLVDDELVAALEDVEERDGPVLAGHLDRAVDLDHRQPPARRRDRVALARVRLLAHQQLVARGLPRGLADHRRPARACGGLVMRGRGHRVLLVVGRSPLQTRGRAGTHRCAPAAQGRVYNGGMSATLDELTEDPHPALARLRASAPVAWVGALDGFLVTRRDLVLSVLRDDATFTVDDPRFSTARVVGPSMLARASRRGCARRRDGS